MVQPASETTPRDATSPPAPSNGPRPRLGARHLPRASNLWTRIGIATGLAVGTLIVLLAVLTFVELHSHAGRVLPGVEVDGVSGRARREIDVYDQVARLAVTLDRSALRARVGGRVLSADPSLLDVSIDARATAADAVAAGRGNPLSEMFGTVLRRFRPDHVHLRVEYDDSRLEGILDGWTAETNNGEVEGDLRFEGAKVVSIEPRTGTGIIRDDARRRLQTMLASARRSIVTLPVGTIHPRVSAAGVASAARRARRLLAGDVTLVAGGTSLRVTPAQLAPALGTAIVGHGLRLTLDGDALHNALGAALAPLESPAVDATFAITSDNTVHVVPSHRGHQIDMAAVARAILHGDRRVVAPVRTIAPRRDTKWARALGIVRQVSTFMTYYPAGQQRVANIHRGADLLNNTVVEPGKVFSLNDTIGPRTAARGFVTAPVFAEGEFFDDYGGGVSQLATTTYNAGFYGGYKDITHQPHTIYISRYPAGREATVNYGAIDLQFQDDTAHGVLIRTAYSDTSITVTLYGDNDGRTVREENRTTSNPVAVTDKQFVCPAPKSVDPTDICATLPAGQTEQVSSGDNGFDVAFDRVIDQPGRPERREHYTWHYTMLPNQFLVGSVPTTTTTLAPVTSTTGPTGPIGSTGTAATSAPRTPTGAGSGALTPLPR
jgi:vancomycin resistance protein YoaR